jgi:hypothetical protein
VPAYVVARAAKGPGIGTRLVSLGGAVWLARLLGRPIVVDWLGSVYLNDPSRNYFTELFEPVPELLGVRVLYAPSPEAGDFRTAPADEVADLHAREIRDLLAEGRPVPRYLVTGGVQTLHDLDPRGDPAEHERFLKEFYAQIVPREHIARELETWYDEQLRGHHVVAVNVSTGNGTFGGGMSKGRGRVDVGALQNERRLLRKLERACRLAAESFPAPAAENYRIFVATDSASTAALLSRLPNAVTRRTVFPPPGAGRRFAAYERLGYSDRASAADVVIDMLLLARCHALVRNESKFSNYALVVTDYFGGNVRDLEGRLYDLEALRRIVHGKGWLRDAPPRRGWSARLERLVR